MQVVLTPLCFRPITSSVCQCRLFSLHFASGPSLVASVSAGCSHSTLFQALHLWRLSVQVVLTPLCFRPITSSVCQCRLFSLHFVSGPSHLVSVSAGCSHSTLFQALHLWRLSVQVVLTPLCFRPITSSVCQCRLFSLHFVSGPSLVASVSAGCSHSTLFQALHL